MTTVILRGWLVAGLVAVDVLLLFCLGLFVRLLGPGKRLTSVAHLLEITKIDVPLGVPQEPLGVISSRPLFDLLGERRRKDKSLAAFLKFPVGRLLMIVHASDTTVRRIIREVRWYAFFVAVLFLAGMLQRIAETTNVSIKLLIEAVGKEPLHMLDLLAMFAIVVCVLRLVAELWHLSDLLLPPQ